MLVKNEGMNPVRREGIAGGKGGSWSLFALPPGSDIEGSHFKMIAKITLDPGASVGEHVHTGNEEVYVLISGTGEFIDDGEKHLVAPGDVMVTFNGHRHSLINTGTDPMEFMAVIVG